MSFCFPDVFCFWRNHTMKTIYLAGGCFWGTQKFLAQFKGVSSTEVGYANGNTENPTYQEVCKGSGHAETVKVIFDETLLPLENLLGFYFQAIDPTSVNKQGEDTGVQYRTGIYYEDASLADGVNAFLENKRQELASQGKALAVESGVLKQFFTAEEYHQDYLDKNPTGYCHLRPELFEIAQKYQV
ncbi:MAG: peptide-methionine (S)-S-oxide reductase MsrA [Lachnospiraceae bacterium]|nr:peptide-methionine (S)-S-oxide reductase MsrA [Lachnospiraceae bacterium]